MVYRGKPSKGCGVCRERKIRCDQAIPTCGQCVKSKRNCPGYRNEVDLMFLDETRKVVKKARTRSSPSAAQDGLPSKDAPNASVSPQLAEDLEGPRLQLAISPLATQSLHDLAVNFVMTNYVGSNANQSQFEYLPDLYQQPGHHEHFNLSICAVGLAGYSAVNRIPELTKTARMKYVSAIRQVNAALESPETARKDSTLASVMLLGMFEVIASPSQQSLETYTKHLNGAVELAKMRSRQQFETEIGISLFRHLSLNIIINCTLQSNPIPEEFIALRRYLPELDDLASPPTRFLDIMLRWLKFAHAVRGGAYSSPSAIVEGALDLDRDLAQFGQTMPRKWQYKTIFGDTDPELVYDGFYYVYEELYVCQLWNNVRLARLRLHKFILEHILPLLQIAKSPELVMRIEASRNTMLQLVSDICATIPQLAGDIPYLSGERLAQALPHPSSIPFSSSSSPQPILKNDGRQRIEHHSLSLWASYASIRPSGQGRNPGQNPEPAGGYFLIWPLFMISKMLITPPRMRQWVINRMQLIGRSFNSDYVEVIMDLITRKGVGLGSIPGSTTALSGQESNQNFAYRMASAS